SATFRISGLTGQASASTKMVGRVLVMRMLSPGSLAACGALAVRGGGACGHRARRAVAHRCVAALRAPDFRSERLSAHARPDAGPGSVALKFEDRDSVAPAGIVAYRERLVRAACERAYAFGFVRAEAPGDGIGLAGL